MNQFVIFLNVMVLVGAVEGSRSLFAEEDDRYAHCSTRLDIDLANCEAAAAQEEGACANAQMTCMDSCLPIGLLCIMQCEWDYFSCTRWIIPNQLQCEHIAFQRFYRCVRLATEGLNQNH